MYYSKKDQCMVFGTEDGLSVFDGKKFKNFIIKIDEISKFQVNFISAHKKNIVFGVNCNYLYLLDIDPNIEKTVIRKFSNFKTFLMYIDHFFSVSDFLKKNTPRKD